MPVQDAASSPARKRWPSVFRVAWAAVKGLKADVDDVSGRILVASLSADYMVAQPGSGRRIHVFRLAADLTKSRFRGRLAWG